MKYAHGCALFYCAYIIYCYWLNMVNILALHTQKSSSQSHYDDLIGFGIGLAPGHRVNQRWDNFWCSDYLYHGSYVLSTLPSALVICIR